MSEINRKAKTLGRWEEILLPEEVEAPHDFNHINPEEVLTSEEVLDIIVKWDGGVADGYQIRNLISRVYGVKLQGGRGSVLEEENEKPNTYKVTLRHDRGFSRFERNEVVKAESAQKAADIMRDKFPEMYVYAVYREVNSWS